ncbi:MAG TPA: DUF3052 domain-containing protein [Roseateles sp.]|nr:DUF3052 domain-containing protein [Roseateles sp.]
MAEPPAPSPAGYSGTPLARKLGIKAASRLLLIDAPPGFAALLRPLPEGVTFMDQAGPQVDIAHVFVMHEQSLAAQLGALRASLRPNAILWISWPKKAARLPTTVTEDRIRALALPLGWVDVKVCAIDAVWSGLLLVVRKALR